MGPFQNKDAILKYKNPYCKDKINVFAQDCGNCIANALVLPQSCAKPS